MQKGGEEGGRREKINDDAKRCNATMNIYQWEIMVLAIRKTNFFCVLLQSNNDTKRN